MISQRNFTLNDPLSARLYVRSFKETMTMGREEGREGGTSAAPSFFLHRCTIERARGERVPLGCIRDVPVIVSTHVKFPINVRVSSLTASFLHVHGDSIRRWPMANNKPIVPTIFLRPGQGLFRLLSINKIRSILEGKSK